MMHIFTDEERRGLDREAEAMLRKVAERRCYFLPGLHDVYVCALAQKDGFTFVHVSVFTACGIPVDAVGFAKCSPKDKPNPEIGKQIALQRACLDIAKQLDEMETKRRMEEFKELDGTWTWTQVVPEREPKP